MTFDPITSIRPGLAVFTLDGTELGQVSDVRGDFFKVNAPLQPDFWLPCAQALSFNIRRVTMNFNIDRLNQYKSDQPEA